MPPVDFVVTVMGKIILYLQLGALLSLTPIPKPLEIIERLTFPSTYYFKKEEVRPLYYISGDMKCA